MDNGLIYFLKKFILDTTSLNFNYLKPPFLDITSIDIGLRNGLKNTDTLYDNFRDIIKTLDYNTFYFYTDSYLLNYVFLHPYDTEDTIVIGPFLKTNVNKEFLNYIAEKHLLKYSEIETIREYLHQLPLFDDNIRIVSILVDIIDYIRPGTSFTTVLSEDGRQKVESEPYVPVDNFMLKAQATEIRYNLEEPLLQAISKGDSSEALSITRHFLSMLYEPRINDALFDKKAALFTTNTLLRIGAGRSQVHPVFLHELSGKFVKLINMATSTSHLDSIHEKMIHEYCLLVQNKARNKYSTLVQNVLNYIDFNLSQQLTLSVLADYFNVSAPYLSKTFKKEVETTVTDYVTNRRIHESLRLLSTTNMQIQDISSYVGILDFNYYAKTFKKYIGCTPTEYRKQLKSK